MENEKKMKVIALKGEENSGKTTTLKKVYELLKAKGGEIEPGSFKNLQGIPKDFLAILNLEGKKIVIVTQGDYYKKGEKNSVKEHLKWLDEDNKCDIVICAWRGMTPTSKHWNIERGIEEILKSYTNPIYLFLQNKSEAEISDNEANQKAKEIVEFLKKLIQHA